MDLKKDRKNTIFLISETNWYGNYEKQDNISLGPLMLRSLKWIIFPMQHWGNNVMIFRVSIIQ